MKLFALTMCTTLIYDVIHIYFITTIIYSEIYMLQPYTVVDVVVIL